MGDISGLPSALHSGVGAVATRGLSDGRDSLARASVAPPPHAARWTVQPMARIDTSIQAGALGVCMRAPVAESLVGRTTRDLCFRYEPAAQTGHGLPGARAPQGS